MKLSRTVTYAVQATLQLASQKSKSPVPCSKLAESGQMPERFLLQILRSLVNYGILHSTRGVDGGYRLDRPADEISLLEVIEAIEGPMSTEFPTSEGLANDSRSLLTKALNSVTEVSRAQLNSIKITSLLPPVPDQSENKSPED